MKKVLMILMIGVMLWSCSEDSEQQGVLREDPLYLSAMTRAPSDGGISDAKEDHSPVQIFLMSGTEKTEGNFVYNTTTQTWVSTIGVKKDENYIFGFSPSSAAAGTIRPLTSGASDYSSGAVMTLDNLNAVGGDDLCVVVGVKYSNTPITDIPSFGTFEFKKQVTSNYVSLLLDHLYAAIEFKIKIGSKYNELRDICLKKMELQSAKTVSQAIVTLTAKDDGTNPITDVSYTTTNNPQSNMVYDYGTDASTTKGIELSKDEEKTFTSYCAPITGMGSSNLKLICTYDVYNKKRTKVRENCVAENSLADLSGLTIERGKKSVINLTVEPTYLYQLSEDELDNPGIKLVVSGN